MKLLYDFFSVLYEWGFALMMGLVTALVVIGIPAVVGLLLEKNKKKKEQLKILAERENKQ